MVKKYILGLEVVNTTLILTEIRLTYKNNALLTIIKKLSQRIAFAFHILIIFAKIHLKKDFLSYILKRNKAYYHNLMV